MLGIGVGLAARLQKAREKVADCDGKIRLRNNITSFSAGDFIEGKVILTTHATKVEFIGLWIRFEGIATCRFDTEVDKDRTTHFKTVRFLPDQAQEPENLEVTFFGKSSRVRSNTVEKILLANGRKGVYEFSFKMQLEDQNLPASFQSRFGRIHYKLVLYASIVRGALYFGGDPFWQDAVLDERVLRTSGNLSLLREPKFSEPVLVSRRKDRSFFSKRTLYKVSLSLKKGAYVPGEKLSGVLFVENPCCELLEKLQITFVNKIMYYDHRFSKGTVSILGEQENFLETTEPEIQWEFNIDIPQKLMPTFRMDERVLEVFYFLQFVLKGSGTQQVKGDTEIIIGTESRNLNEVPNQSADSTEDVEPVRKITTDQKWNEIALSSGTLPPSYSNLSSRRSSIATLPPAYDTVFGNGNWDEVSPGGRPRSSSIGSIGQMDHHLNKDLI